MSASGESGDPTSLAKASTLATPDVPDAVSGPRPVDRSGLHNGPGALGSAVNGRAANESAPALRSGGIAVDHSRLRADSHDVDLDLAEQPVAVAFIERGPRRVADRCLAHRRPVAFRPTSAPFSISVRCPFTLDPAIRLRM